MSSAALNNLKAQAAAPVTKRYYKPKEAAAYLGMGYSTLSIHRMNNTGPLFIKFGTSIRYDVAELDRWMAERAVTGRGGKEGQ